MASEDTFNILDPFRSIDLGIADSADGIKQWAISNRDIIQPIKTVLNEFLVAIDTGLNAVPPVIMLVLITLIAWQAAGSRVAIVVGLCLVGLGLLDPNAWPLAMTTLAIVVSAVTACFIIGLPLGILCAKSDTFERILRPALDLMQTIPAVVYLVPVAMLIGIVLSGIGVQSRDHTTLITALRRKERLSDTRIGALCSGSWVLALGGFLNGQDASIHWEYHDSFMEKFPEVNLLRNVFVSDGKYPTASGGTATADLILHLISESHGPQLSVAVADQMVYNTVRGATAAQKVSLQSRNGMRNLHIATAIARMERHLENPVSPAIIARDLGISIRQLERLFGKYLNTSPKKYYMDMRLDRARNLLVQTEMSIIDVAVACGFESAGHFSRVYRTAFGCTPMMQRARLT